MGRGRSTGRAPVVVDLSNRPDLWIADTFAGTMRAQRPDGADDDGAGEYSRTPYFVAKFGVTFVGAVLLAIGVLLRFTSLSTAEVLDAINIVVSVLLTGALILLYRDLGVIQSRQVRAMEASYTPLVGITAWELTAEAFEEDSPTSSERLVLTLSNQGNSMARDLRVRAALAIETTDHDVRIRSMDVPLNRTEGRSWWHSDRGAVLPEKTSDVEFYATPNFLYSPPDGGDDRPIRFDDAVDLLAAAGVEEARVALSLRYRSAAGGTAEIDFATFEIDVPRLHDGDACLRRARRVSVADATEIKANARMAE